MNTGWVIPFIILGGVPQACGATMNGQLGKSLVNPWRGLGAALLIGGVALIAKF